MLFTIAWLEVAGVTKNLKGENMAGLAKLGDKSRSKKGAQEANKTKGKRAEPYHKKVERLKKELPWPYNMLIEFKKGGKR
tara:strand:+ start:1990 stop:2229 length:240 start_codon:yes stop_codon:yes gene_type:complete